MILITLNVDEDYNMKKKQSNAMQLNTEWISLGKADVFCQNYTVHVYHMLSQQPFFKIGLLSQSINGCTLAFYRGI